MKSTKFRKVIHEEIIEVKTSVADTINRLCEQAGKCSAETPDGSPLFIDCSKKGSSL